MNELRDSLLQPMAQAILDAFIEWEANPSLALGVSDHQASAALDALLDGLEERRDEWFDAVVWRRDILQSWEHGLLAALRAGKGSDDGV